MGKVIDGIVGQAYSEWEFFGRQEFDIDGNRIREGMDETEEGFWQRVGLYWREGMGKNFTGRDDDEALKVALGRKHYSTGQA